MNQSQNSKIFQTSFWVIKKIKEKGFLAFLVGGAVRDLILKRSLHDIDIATSAQPEEIEKIFSRTKPVGKEFGVILVLEDGLAIEVATFRQESDYADGRRPKSVEWTEVKTDAFRRDLTINALYLDLQTDTLAPLELQKLEQEKDFIRAKTNLGDIFDYTSGLQDLEKKLIRFVGLPKERINEDYLRIIRAIRFKAELDFDYAQDLTVIFQNNKDKLKNISGERLREEFDRILKSSCRARGMSELDELGILNILIPELEPLKKIEQSKKFFQSGNAFDHTILVLSHLPESIDVDIAWAGLLHDIGKAPTMEMGYDRKKNWTERFPNHNVVGAEMAKKILERFKFSSDRSERILWLVTNHQMPPEVTRMREGKQRRWLLDARLPDLLNLHKADAMGKEKKVYLGWHDQVKRMMAEELAKPPPPPKLIDGHEIMKKFNLLPGPEIGRLLKIVEDAVWDNKISTKEEALELVKKNIDRQ